MDSDLNSDFSELDSDLGWDSLSLWHVGGCKIEAENKKKKSTKRKNMKEKGETGKENGVKD
jgi:hypothetical protein